LALDTIFPFSIEVDIEAIWNFFFDVSQNIFIFSVLADIAKK
jgi:hypothetical protein